MIALLLASLIPLDGVFGDWSVRFSDKSILTAREFAFHRDWTVETNGESVVYRADRADVTIVTRRDGDAVTVQGSLTVKADAVATEFAVPARRIFSPDEMVRLHVPGRGNSSPGLALNDRFFRPGDTLRTPIWRQLGPSRWKRPPGSECQKLLKERAAAAAVVATDRRKIGVIRFICGPLFGAGVSPQSAANTVRGFCIDARKPYEIVELKYPRQIAGALAGNDFRMVVNPFGDAMPMESPDDRDRVIAAIRDYEARGGRYVSAAKIDEITPFVADGKQRGYYEGQYPNFVMDYWRLEFKSGDSVTAYGVQPRDRHLFQPAQYKVGSYSNVGYIDRAWSVYARKGETVTVPATRLVRNRGFMESIGDYAKANGITRRLDEKAPAAVIEKLRLAPIAKHNGTKITFEESAKLVESLPPPLLVHPVWYLHGGFDKQYPDHLPVISSLGTDADFLAYVKRLQKRGDLVMPYTNPTWWCDHPRGPTFLAAGEAPLLVREDGTHNREVYKDDGWTICFWHPAVIAANRKTIGQFTEEIPMDIVFQDQCGARRCPLDFNPASPSPTAYTEGLLRQLAEDARRVPLATEDGWDRVANEETIVCGMMWGMCARWDDIARGDYRPLEKEGYLPAETFEYSPLALYLLHDKCFFYHHDLSGTTHSPRILAWQAAFGCGMFIDISPATYGRNAGIRAWYDKVLRFQREVASRYAGRKLLRFRHDRSPLFARSDVTPACRSDDGVVDAVWDGGLRLIVNLGDVSRTAFGFSLAPYEVKVAGTGVSRRD